VFVGRDGELDRVATALGLPDCRLVIVGEAGIGKTRLVDESSARASRPLLIGGALSTLSWMAYLPLRRALGESLTAPGWTDDPESAAARVEEALDTRALFLDDLHWADTATLEVVKIIAGRVPLIATVRTGAERAARTLEVLGGIGVEVLELRPLDTAAAIDLARSVRPDADPRDLEGIARRSGGNPLVVEELALGGPRERSLTLALAARLHPLSPGALHDLRVLALAERPLPAADLAHADVILEAGLAVAERDQLQPRSVLLAEIVADGIPAEAAPALHRELAGLLKHPGEIAHHLLLAGDHSAGLAAAMRAVDEASTPGERSQHLLTAARCAAEDAEPELLVRAAQAAVDAGEHASAGEILTGLQTTDRHLRARAAVLRATICRETSERDGWIRWASEAVALAPADTDVEVIALAEQARATLLAGQNHADALEIAERAVALGRARGAYRGRGLYVLGSTYYFRGDDRWRTTLEKAREFAHVEGDLFTEIVAANNLIVCHESSGSQSEGARIADEMVERMTRLQLERWRRHFAAARINIAMHAGALEKVDVEAARLLARPLMARTRVGVAAAWGMVLIDLARFDEALVIADEELECSMFPSHANHLRAEVRAALEDPQGALAELPLFLDRVENEHFLALAAPLFHWAALRAGIDEPQLPDFGLAFEVPMLRGVPHELEAVRAVRGGDPAGALAELDEAGSFWGRYHRRGEVRCLVAAAEIQVDVATGIPAPESSRARADAVKRVALAQRRAGTLGMAAELRRIERLRRRLGMAPTARTGTSSGGLSERERQVLDLVLRGLTDAAISARLGISARTVETHIQSARRKLGASNRDQAAALAADT
jgi:DNA-binding CsgD family transcriptional regulator